MKRRKFLKALIAAPVVVKVSVEAIAKPKSGEIVFASVIEENPTLEVDIRREWHRSATKQLQKTFDQSVLESML